MSGAILSSGVRGMTGGYVHTIETGGSKVAELVLRIANGEHAKDIGLENAPATPMFDWRELRRWNISEESLPVRSVVHFKEFSFWQQYKWRIVGGLTLIFLQTAFIGVLLMERKRRQRAREALAQLNTELEQRIATRTAALNNKTRELETFAYSVAHALRHRCAASMVTAVCCLNYPKSSTGRTYLPENHPSARWRS
jgi:hypothetical protein